jgi:hypothetical protein
MHREGDVHRMARAYGTILYGRGPPEVIGVHGMVGGMPLGHVNGGLAKGEVAHGRDEEGHGFNRAKPFAVRLDQTGTVQVEAVEMLD